MKTTFLTVALIFIASCAIQRFSIDPSIKGQTPSSDPHLTKISHFFLLGVGQKDFINANEICKDKGGIAFVEVRQGPFQAIVEYITWRIYSPRTVRVYCNNGK